MEPVTSDAAPAQPEVPAAPLTPAHQAVADNDFTRFETIERENLKSGKPTPAPAAPVETKPEPVAAAPVPAEESKTVSKRQQQINDYERTIAEQRAELAQLRAPKPAAAPRSDTTPTPAAPLTLADTIARPDLRQAPLTEAAFYSQHADAGVGDYADYRANYRYHYNRIAEQRQTVRQQADQSEQTRVSKARAGLEDAAKADPTFTAKIGPLLTTLQTREQAQADGLRPGPEHDFGSALVRSEVAAQILAHLADHPEVMADVRALESRADVLTYFGELQAQFRKPTTSPAPQAPSLKTVPSAPEPPAVLGTRSGVPADALATAVQRGDYLAFERAERERLTASTVRR